MIISVNLVWLTVYIIQKQNNLNHSFIERLINDKVTLPLQTRITEPTQIVFARKPRLFGYNWPLRIISHKNQLASNRYKYKSQF